MKAIFRDLAFSTLELARPQVASLSSGVNHLTSMLILPTPILKS